MAWNFRKVLIRVVEEGHDDPEKPDVKLRKDVFTRRNKLASTNIYYNNQPHYCNNTPYKIG